MPSITKKKKKLKKENCFGSSDCKHATDEPMPGFPANWYYHLSYCYPDRESPHANTPHAQLKYLHVTAYYNVHAQLGLEQQNDIRCHYGYKPQNLALGPTGWASQAWYSNDLPLTQLGQNVMEFCRYIFNDLAPNQIIQ